MLDLANVIGHRGGPAAFASATSLVMMFKMMDCPEFRAADYRFSAP
jgi:hypothetical protein